MSLLALAKFERFTGGYRWIWEQDRLSLAFSRIKERSDGLYARVAAWALHPGANEVLSASEFRLLSEQSRDRFAKHLGQRVSTIDWSEYIEATCIQAVVEHERGTPVVKIVDDGVPVEETKYLVKPVIVEGVANMWFGDGDAGKSILAEHVSYFLGFEGTKLGLTFSPKVVIYLDYETSEEEFRARIKSIGQTWGTKTAGNIFYRHCDQPIFEEVDALQQLVMDHKADLVIIDSYGYACGGDAISQDTVRRTAMALRALGVTTLGIHHISAEVVKGGKVMPYGNRYWHNWHRWSWWIQGTKDSAEIAIGVHHQKHNVGPYWDPLGFVLHWNGNVPILKRDDGAIARNAELRERLPSVRAQLKSLLAHYGVVPVERLIEEIGNRHEKRIRNLLTEGKASGEFAQEGRGEWRLILPGG